ncbi:MAG: Lrp/AsnC family transcriptional regulator [Lachnospiraceae bacterium]|nr:Lrp/AsnC family transcriptional regulator [Lachnospiraceae bacterium]
MNIDGLDALDDRILDVIKHNARATFSEIGKMVGLSRVAVKNRMDILEKKGVIQGYKTVIDKTKVPSGVQFILDVEVVPELYQEVVEVLGTDSYLRQVYSTTGDCRLHATGFAPNMNTLESHVNHLFRNTKGIRKLSWHLLLSTIKDEDGGVEYVRYQKPEHLERERQ